MKTTNGLSESFEFKPSFNFLIGFSRGICKNGYCIYPFDERFRLFIAELFDNALKAPDFPLEILNCIETMKEDIKSFFMNDKKEPYNPEWKIFQNDFIRLHMPDNPLDSRDYFPFLRKNDEYSECLRDFGRNISGIILPLLEGCKTNKFTTLGIYLSQLYAVSDEYERIFTNSIDNYLDECRSNFPEIAQAALDARDYDVKAAFRKWKADIDFEYNLFLEFGIEQIEDINFEEFPILVKTWDIFKISYRILQDCYDNKEVYKMDDKNTGIQKQNPSKSKKKNKNSTDNAEPSESMKSDMQGMLRGRIEYTCDDISKDNNDNRSSLNLKSIRVTLKDEEPSETLYAPFLEFSDKCGKVAEQLFFTLATDSKSKTFCMEDILQLMENEGLNSIESMRYKIHSILARLIRRAAGKKWRDEKKLRIFIWDRNNRERSIKKNSSDKKRKFQENKKRAIGKSLQCTETEVHLKHNEESAEKDIYNTRFFHDFDFVDLNKMDSEPQYIEKTVLDEMGMKKIT